MRSEEERAFALETAEGVLGEVDRRRGDRLRHLGELRLGPHALAGVKSVFEETVQHRPRCTRAEGGLVGEADLAEDLRLSRNERIQARGDAEEMLDRLAALPHGQHALQLEARAPFEVLTRNRRVTSGQVDLGAVAGRAHDRAQLLRELDRMPVGEVEPFAQLERGVPVRHADREQTFCLTRAHRTASMLPRAG